MRTPSLTLSTLSTLSTTTIPATPEAEITSSSSRPASTVLEFARPPRIGPPLPSLYECDSCERRSTVHPVTFSDRTQRLSCSSCLPEPVGAAQSQF